ncbi:hypothetical protein [Devosia sp. 2618]|uniref:hypothetical protein n=1 Tax=Devosia sp. 2618 TaxID=3156454 RepID=UPI003397F326
MHLTLASWCQTRRHIVLSGSQPAAEVRTGHGSARFAPLWSNLWAIEVGYWLGRGHSAKAVAEIVGDGTSEGTVKGQLRRAGLCGSTPPRVVVPVEMASWQRDAIVTKAAKLGIEPNVLIMRVVESSILLDDLYEVVTDGRYADAPLPSARS